MLAVQQFGSNRSLHRRFEADAPTLEDGEEADTR